MFASPQGTDNMSEMLQLDEVTAIDTASFVDSFAGFSPVSETAPGFHLQSADGVETVRSALDGSGDVVRKSGEDGGFQITAG